MSDDTPVEGAAATSEDSAAADREPAAGTTATAVDEPTRDEAPPHGSVAPIRRRVRSRLVIGVGITVLAVVAVVAAVAWRRPPPPPKGLVILYGDSLSLEASGAFIAEMGRLADVELALRPMPGLSPCDALDRMRVDMDLEPDVVVLQYVGNNASDCVLGPDGEQLTGDALVERFEADVRTATDLFAANGARVVLVGGPHAPGLPGKASLGIADAYNEIVNDWAGRDLGRVRYADAAATVTGDDHLYEDRLPCRDDEGPEQGCDDGQVTVRNPDRIHFCPVDHDQLVCSVPSPGARRFGEEIARVAAMALDPEW